MNETDLKQSFAVELTPEQVEKIKTSQDIESDKEVRKVLQKCVDWVLPLLEGSLNG